MYPDFQYLFQSLLGVDVPSWLSIFKVFGFFVAMGFIAGARVLTQELKRKEKEGLLQPVMGVEKDKSGNKVKRLIYPHERIFDIIVVAIIAGLVGAKIFNAFETWDYFIQDPVGNLFSASGLTFYGGLIMATIALYYFARKYKIDFKHLCDAAAPALILAYGIGRLGCHFAGDGDWGIYNSAYVSTADGSMVKAAPGQFEAVLEANKNYFIREFGSLENVPHKRVEAPAGIPRWLYAMNYAHNVNNDGVRIHGCEGNYCAMLPVGVFPTPIYEAVVCIALFALLYANRLRFKRPLQMFGWYLMFNGIERFFVEKIRVNSKYDWGFIHPTQAEIISVIMFVIGLYLAFAYKPKRNIAPQGSLS